MANMLDSLTAPQSDADSAPVVEPTVGVDDKGNVVLTITPGQMATAKKFKRSTGFRVNARFKTASGAVIEVQSRWLGFTRVA